MLKTIGGLVAGFIVAVILLAAVDYAAAMAAPEAGTATRLVIGGIAIVAATFVGGLVSLRISHERWTVWGIALLMVLMTFASLLVESQDAGPVIASVLAPLIGAWLATRGAAAHAPAARPES